MGAGKVTQFVSTVLGTVWSFSPHSPYYRSGTYHIEIERVKHYRVERLSGKKHLQRTGYKYSVTFRGETKESIYWLR